MNSFLKLQTSGVVTLTRNLSIGLCQLTLHFELQSESRGKGLKVARTNLTLKARWKIKFEPTMRYGTQFPRHYLHIPNLEDLKVSVTPLDLKGRAKGQIRPTKRFRAYDFLLSVFTS